MRKSKYNAHKVHTEDYGDFDSSAEYRYFLHLLARCRNGEVSGIERQKVYELVPTQKAPSGKRMPAIKYIADFVFVDSDGTHVQDVKGYRSPADAAYRVFTIKKKLMLQKYGIEIEEITMTKGGKNVQQ